MERTHDEKSYGLKTDDQKKSEPESSIFTKHPINKLQKAVANSILSNILNDQLDEQNSIKKVLDTPGKPLDIDTRFQMEKSFDYDFGDVRIHTDSEASRSAQNLNAAAYTVGNDIVFGEGQYKPCSNEGKEILAHELTHVVQQDCVETVQKKRITPVSDNAFEAEADAAAKKVLEGKEIETGSITRLSKTSSAKVQFSREGGYGTNSLANLGNPFMSEIPRRALNEFKELIIPDFIENRTMPSLTYQQMLEFILKLEESELVSFVNNMVLQGTIISFIPAVKWDPRIMNKIIFYLPKQILLNLIEIDKVGFMKWIATKIEERWPIGMGYILTGDLGATFGYPIYAGADAKGEIYHSQPYIFELTKYSRFTLAGDTGIGPKFGKESKKKGPLGAYGEIQAGVKVAKKEKFELQINNDESFIPTLVGIAYGSLPTPMNIVKEIVGFVLFEKYRKELKIEISPYAAAAGYVGASIITKGNNKKEHAIEPDVDKNNKSKDSEDNKENSMWKLIPEAFIRAGINIELGAGFTIEQETPQGKAPFKISGKAAASILAMAKAHLKSILNKKEQDKKATETIDDKKKSFGDKASSVFKEGGIGIINSIISKLISLNINLLDLDIEGEISFCGTFDRETMEIDWTKVEMQGKSKPDDDLNALLEAGTIIQADISLKKEDTPARQFFRDNPTLLKFYDLIPDELSIEKRHAVGTGFGNLWFDSNSQFLRTILPDEQYFNNGAVIEGLLIFKFTLKKDKLEALFMWLVELATGKGKARDEVLAMWNDILELFKTGKVPSWLPDIKKVTDFLEANDNCLSAEGRFTFGLTLAAGGSVAKGAKLRLEAGATGVMYKRVDIVKSISTEIIKKIIVENFDLFLKDKD